MSPQTLARRLTIALLATLTACTTLDGPQRRAPASTASGGGTVAPSESPSAAAPNAGASTAPGSSGPSSSRAPNETAGATQALLAQSRAARAAGNYPQANATIERALRIAPSNPNLWVELGEIELASGNPAQAATLARKALTLAANDRVATADAEKLLRAAGAR